MRMIIIKKILAFLSTKNNIKTGELLEVNLDIAFAND